jgi:glyoxylase-like metal-dependent hydrolase (beta-lactamase superfamily II)
VRFTTGRNLLGVMPVTAHCYRVGSTLVDAGSPNRARELAARFEEEISHVLLTHAHEDHVGAAARLAASGAVVFAPEPLLERLTDPPELPYFRRWSWGEAEGVEARPLDGVVETPDGRFEAVATPGHSPHHVALHETDRDWLFSGDAFLGKRREHRFAENLDALLDSLDRMRALQPKRLWPGHGSPRDAPVAALEELSAHYADLLADAREVRAEGAHVRTVRNEVLGREGFLTLYTGGEFSKLNLARQLLASRRLDLD